MDNRRRIINVASVYLLDDKVWLLVEHGDREYLFAAEHNQRPMLITQEVVKAGMVPQEIIDWYKED